MGLKKSRKLFFKEKEQYVQLNSFTNTERRVTTLENFFPTLLVYLFILLVALTYLYSATYKESSLVPPKELSSHEEEKKTNSEYIIEYSSKNNFK